ncbi:hypothetical protein KO488_12345 [Poseidonibacter lekithochrous]|uniref:hypothetical protein n=1 Tax=Poseidonibacter TaxID=2321187 RepID=UPI001C09244C|nr:MULTISPECIES: hypothetical protein [Poseidonibacter]MBU3015550.1 hypothetical protein [Poseidonibacter lekithochrous]MDO6828849.1 hypothetical protein [Poseidonibacter sp. 1_MG-2023]
MKRANLIIISLLFFKSILFAQNKEVSNLLEKVNQAPSTNERKELIEELKEKLAAENKKAQEEADAIIKAKEKMPIKIYKEKAPLK